MIKFYETINYLREQKNPVHLPKLHTNSINENKSVRLVYEVIV